MSYWETSARNNFAEKALELLELRRLPALAERDIDCTLLLASLTMLLCNTRDSVRAAKDGDDESFGTQSIPAKLKTTYAKKLTDDGEMKSVARMIRVSPWRKQEPAPRPIEVASEVNPISPDMTIARLITDLRNAVAHGSVEWTKDGKGQINGALFMTAEHEKSNQPQRWRAVQLELRALERVTKWWARQLIDSPAPPSEHAVAIELASRESAVAA